MSETQDTLRLIYKQAQLRDKFYKDNDSVDVKEFTNMDLHSQIWFLLKFIVDYSDGLEK